MKLLLFTLIIASAALLLAATFLHRKTASNAAPAENAENAAPSVRARVPVIVELFTSEGCSSCPPADALLLQLEKSQPVPNAEIIALSEHVDYWNYIGWSDPFSSAAYSARQQAYAEAFGRDGVYTPQLVVDGQYEFVGSNAAKARAAIAQAARTPKATVQITLVNPPQERAALRLQVRASELPPGSVNEQAEIILALTENNLHSNVARGENSGRKLAHTAVVRELRTLGAFAPAAQSFTAEATVVLNGDWKRNELRAIAFVQERAQRRILGAAALSLATQ